MDQLECSRRDLLRALGASGVAASLGGHAVGTASADGDRWSQSGHGAAKRGYAPGHTGPTSAVGERWAYHTGTTSRSSPAVHDGTVYAGGQSGVYAVDQASGDLDWRADTNGPVLTTPAVAGESVVAKSPAGDVYGFDAGSGDRVWRVGTDASRVAAPAVAGDTVFVGGGATLSALDASTGDERWTRRADDSGYTAPTVANGGVYAGGSGGYVDAVDAGSGDPFQRYRTGGRLAAAPAVANGTVYAVRDDGDVHAFDADSGQRLWRNDTGRQPTRPAVDDRNVYVGTAERVYALDARTGEQQWWFPTGGTAAAPAVAGDLVYVGGPKGVHALDPGSGQQQWRYDAIETAGSPAVVNDGVYVGSEDGAVHALGEGALSGGLLGRAGPLSGLPAALASRPGWQVGAAAGGAVVAGSGAVYGAVALLGGSSDGQTETDESAAASGASTEGDESTTASGDSAEGDESAATNEEGAPASKRTDEPGGGSEAPADPSAETDAGGGGATSGAEHLTAAVGFADACEGVDSATTVDDDGPVHEYDGRLADGTDARIYALAPDHAESEAAERVTRTARQWASISHNQHVAEVYDSGASPRPWVAFEPGDRWLADAGSSLDGDDHARVLDGVAEGLTTGGLYNVSHGSLAPETVTLAGNGRELTATVADWGVSVAVERALGEQPVTPYTAPEQLDGGAAATTDVYRAGLLAYWLVTGREPYADAEDLRGAIERGDLTPPSEVADVPAAVDDVVAVATATVPEERYSSATRLRDALREALD